MPGFNDESVRLALRGRFIVRTYPFPGLTGINIAVRLLKDGELDAVRLQAVEECKSKKVELVADPEFLDRLIHRETIARAMFDADDHTQSFFGSHEDVAELDALTVRALYELYMMHAQAMDPYAYCPASEVQALAEALGKSEWPAESLSLFDLPTARTCLLSLAQENRELRAELERLATRK